MNILFVGIDGTLTETHSGDTFKRDANDVKVMDGARESIERYADMGWAIIGISNQGGCSAINKETGKPFKTIPDVVAEMHRTMELIPEINVIYFCPDFAGRIIVEVGKAKGSYWQEKHDNGKFRKPQTGMIQHALNTLIDDAAEEGIDIGVEECWLVGDREEDEQCAINAGIDFCPASLFKLASSKLPDNIVLTDKELQFLVF